MDLKRYDRSLLRELSECLKQNDPARAMAVFEAHSIAQPSMLHTQEYNRLLAVLSSDPKQGGRVRAHMLARGVQDDETTVTLEVRRLVRCADFDGATALLQSAQDQGIVPKIRTYSALLRALTERRAVDGAVRVFDRMQGAALLPPEEDMAELAPAI